MRAAWLTLQLAIVAAAIAVVVAWRHYGYVPIAVQSGSMEPTIPIRSLLFVREVPDSEIRVGDVITFDPAGSVPRTTHRVVQREHVAGRWYFLTKGDANPAVDDWRRSVADSTGAEQLSETYRKGISYTDGRAVRTEAHVPHLGRIAALASVPYLRPALVVAPFAIIAMYVLWWIWRPVLRRRRVAAPSRPEPALPAATPRTIEDDREAA